MLPKLLLLSTIFVATSCRTVRQTATQTESQEQVTTDTAATLHRRQTAAYERADTLSQFAALAVDSLRLELFCPSTRTAPDSSATAVGPLGGYPPNSAKPSVLTLYGLRLSRAVRQQSTVQSTYADSSNYAVQATSSAERSSVHNVHTATKQAKPFSYLKLAIANISFLACAVWVVVRWKRRK